MKLTCKINSPMIKPIMNHLSLQWLSITVVSLFGNIGTGYILGFSAVFLPQLSKEREVTTTVQSLIGACISQCITFYMKCKYVDLCSKYHQFFPNVWCHPLWDGSKPFWKKKKHCSLHLSDIAGLDHNWCIKWG